MKYETDCIANVMYTAVGMKDDTIEVVSSKFYRGVMQEEKIKMLYELGMVNGVYIDTNGKLKIIEDNVSAEVQKDETIKKKRVTKEEKEETKDKKE